MYLFSFLTYANETSSAFVIKMILLALCLLTFLCGQGCWKEVGAASYCIVQTGLQLAVLPSLLSASITGVCHYAQLFPLLGM